MIYQIQGNKNVCICMQRERGIKNIKLKEEKDNTVFVLNRRDRLWLLCRKWDKN